MADDARVIQGIDWRRTFNFTHIFRSFRIAIHPSKLLLALLGLVLLYGGGRFMDAVWPTNHLARYEALADRQVDEIQVYEGTYSRARYEELASKLQGRRGLFISFFEYEIGQIDGVVKGVRDWRWVSGPAEHPSIVAPPVDQPSAPDFMGMPPEVRSAYLGTYLGTIGNLRAMSVTQAMRNFVITGPAWAFTHHTVYFVIFGLWFLLIWSIFGGAIARIAAIHVARDEKLSIRQALRFSVGKLLSFLFAPVIPLVIVIVVGLVVTAGALLGDIPWVGPIIVGVFFFLALAAGFVMTLVLLGTIGGFNLMYPTIAVEGSDSFDAISRSFSYLYARPWRMAFYTLVALIYGALCYLFVRLFIWMMLALTHYFVDLGMFVHAGNGGNLELFNTMWMSPVQAGRLVYHINYDALNWGERVGAFFIAAWVYLVIAMLGAFAISFYFSANTVIYYLMRQEVDATELDDVYVEQSDEDFGEAAPTPAPVMNATATTAPTTSTLVTPVETERVTPAAPDTASASEAPVPTESQPPPAT